MNEIPYAIAIFLIPFAGLHLANIAVDKDIPFPIARKIGHICGGIPYFISPFLFSTPFWTFVVSALFTVMLGYSHFFLKRSFRGVGGISRPMAMAEVSYPLGATICIVVGWWWMNNPWLGIVPILFMAWGDGVSGLIRYFFLHRESYLPRKIKNKCGSWAFLLTGLLVSLLFNPYWIALVGLLVTIPIEAIFGENALIKMDDNLPIQLSALIVMSIL